MQPSRQTRALLLYVAIAAALLGPYLLPATQLSLHSYDAVTDGYLFMWNFWWTKHALFQLQNPYWTELLNHPFGTSLVFHTFPLTYDLLSIPVQLLWPGPGGLALALNAACFTSFVLSAWGAYLLAVRVTGSQAGALIAGLLFSFTPYHFLNATNLHKAAFEVLPFYVLACLRLHERPTAARAAVLAGALAVAFYTSMEFALHLAIWSALWLGTLLATRAASTAFVARLALAFGLFLALALPLLAAQARALAGGDGSFVEQPGDFAGRHNPALVSLVTPSRVQRLWGDALRSAGAAEYGGDPGVRGVRSETSLSFALLLLAAVALATGRRRRERWFWAVAAAILLVLALGPHLRLTGTRDTGIPLPYAVVAWVLPPLRASRDPARFEPLAVLMLSLLAAYGMRDLLDRIANPKARRVVPIAIGAAVLFEFWPQSFSKLTPEIHPASARIHEAAGDFAVLDLRPEPYRLLDQTAHAHPITNVRESVPRSEAGHRLTLAEGAFREPGRVLELDAAGAAARVAAVRRDLQETGIRFIVFPLAPITPTGASSLAAARLELAQRLGTRIERVAGLAVCELGAGRAPQHE